MLLLVHIDFFEDIIGFSVITVNPCVGMVPKIHSDTLKPTTKDRAQKLRQRRIFSRIPIRFHPRTLMYAVTTLNAEKRARAFVRLARLRERHMDWVSARSLYRSAVAGQPHCYENVIRLALLDIMLADAPEKLIQVEDLLQRMMVTFKVECEADPDSIVATTLARLLYQRGADELGNTIVRKLNCSHRLAPCILHYAVAKPSSYSIYAPAAVEDVRRYVQAVDDAIPDDMLQHMKEAFSPTSPFWREHNYCPSPPSPYFSYLHVVTDHPTTAIENVLAYVLKMTCRHFPGVREAKYVEWWAHCRPHCSGHQMHFDSDDEGRGGVRCCASACILLVEFFNDFSGSQSYSFNCSFH